MITHVLLGKAPQAKKQQLTFHLSMAILLTDEILHRFTKALVLPVCSMSYPRIRRVHLSQACGRVQAFGHVKELAGVQGADQMPLLGEPEIPVDGAPSRLPR